MSSLIHITLNKTYMDLIHKDKTKVMNKSIIVHKILYLGNNINLMVDQIHPPGGPNSLEKGPNKYDEIMRHLREL